MHADVRNYGDVTGIKAQIKPSQMLTKGEKVTSINMQTVGADELDKVKATVELSVVKDGEFDRIVGWFDSYFTRGGKTVKLGTPACISA